jgi:predicted membrane-bound spermidine synthase
MDARPIVLERTAGRCGELVLRRAGEHLEVIANGVFLMDTRNGESERLLVSAAAQRMPGGGSKPGGNMPGGGRMLIGGLGVGFSLRQACADQRVREIIVVEREPAVIGWARGPLRGFGGEALEDPRVRVVEADLVDWLAATTARFDAICLDVDNGPQWTVSDSNGALYSDSGLCALSSRLTAGGVLAVWSAAADPAFDARLRYRFSEVEALRVPVPRGEPDVVWLARAARQAG